MGNSNDFSEQILTAVNELGEDEASKCMCKMLAAIAHQAEEGLEFCCSLGTVSIKPAAISLIAEK